jgi:succinate dehydrogenase / fumarate reductase membrane anchor subunit
MAIDKTSIRTPRSRVQFLGSAKSGTEQAWAMRVTSAALVVLTVGFVSIVLSLVGKDYAAAKAAIHSPFAAVTLLLFVLVGLYHAKLGFQTVIEDYVHAEPAKHLALYGNIFFTVAAAFATVFAVLKLAL